MYIHLFLQVKINPVIGSSWLVILSFICAYVYLFIHNPLIHSQSLKWIMRLGSCWMAIHTLSCPYVHLFNSFIYSLIHWCIHYLRWKWMTWLGSSWLVSSAECSGRCSDSCPSSRHGSLSERELFFSLVWTLVHFISYLKKYWYQIIFRAIDLFYSTMP